MSIQTLPLDDFYKICRYGRGKFWYKTTECGWHIFSRSDIAQFLRVIFNVPRNQTRAIINVVKEAATAEEVPELAKKFEWEDWTGGLIQNIEDGQVVFYAKRMRRIKTMTIADYNKVIRERFPDKPLATRESFEIPIAIPL